MPGPRFTDLSGKRFGRLTCLRRGEKVRKYMTWLCRCDCGNEVTVISTNMMAGTRSSCGCDLKERASVRAKTHGMSGTAEHSIWSGIKDRCGNPRSKDYSNYGGRGIVICPEWIDDFPRFLADMGARPSNAHSIDRIDNDGPYSPTNCRWAVVVEQCNNKRNNRLLTHEGETLSIAQWARRTGMAENTIRNRLLRGWNAADTLNRKPAPPFYPVRHGQRVRPVP